MIRFPSIPFLGYPLRGEISQSSYFIQKKMFYSPKKNLEAFLEAKNDEIKSLKQKILGTRITYEDMQTAKSRLNGLKNSYLHLQREDHLELKEVLKTSHQAINDLVKKKNRLTEELQLHGKQTQQMHEMQCELKQKKQKADQFYRDVWTTKQKLTERKQKKNKQILELQQQLAIRRKQLTMQREIGQQLEVARGQFKSKVIKVNKDLAQVSEQNKKHRECIKKQLQDISKLEFQQQNDSLRVENLQLRIEKEEKNCQNLQHKIDAAQIFMQRFSEDKLIYLKQSETSINLDSLLKMCAQSNEKKQKDQKQCQQQISYLEKEIQKAFYARQKLMKSMNNKKQNLKELKEKGTELKSILNSIFHQDSSVLKLLADKKVYESEQSPKKINSHITTDGKQDLLDLMDTSDNFFIKAGN